jgi:AcrR family transcriptional regulator
MGADLMKKEIKRTFIALLNEKPLTQITVKQLAAECGINRNSFYYHYPDIPALIEEITREEADRIISEYSTIDSLETVLHAAVSFGKENRRAILHIFNSVSRDIFERYLWNVCDYLVTAYGKKVIADVEVSKLDEEVIKRFYRCECFGFTIAWLSENMTTDVTEQIRRFCELHRGLPEEMIRRSVEDKSANTV